MAALIRYICYAEGNPLPIAICGQHLSGVGLDLHSTDFQNERIPIR